MVVDDTVVGVNSEDTNCISQTIRGLGDIQI